jgi:hypothetical protein
MSLLHAEAPDYSAVVTDSQASIRLLPANMKAYFFLAQGQIELHLLAAALGSALEAHRLCVEECRKIPMGKGASSIGPITELVLRCKKEWWEQREKERLEQRCILERDLSEMLRERGETEEKIEALREVFERASEMGSEGKRRRVPDWCIDDITFSVMLDPVVVCSPCANGGRGVLRWPKMLTCAKTKTDEDGPILRSRLFNGTPQARAHRSTNARATENGRLAAKPRVEGSLCSVSRREWVGC